jgi:magnesium chelatase subunit D
MGGVAVKQLPFSAVVGQEDAKLALLLNAVDPRIGGVLLRGEKGSAKSTLARGLAALLRGSAPFVELPLGATEDRVVGTIDVAVALTGGGTRFAPGLLADADGGVLYVDEINLLPDHLVDVLLDVAASGVNRVEREGISHAHPSRFLLVGSMNPEEGDLRPQLLDRFGLAVDIRSSTHPAQRAAAVRRRLEFDETPDTAADAFAGEEAILARRLAEARPARLPGDLIDAVSGLCASVGAEGLRADLTICRAAAALGGWEGRSHADESDVRRVAPMALAHRARRDPLDPAGVAADMLDEAMDEHLGHDPGDEGAGDDTDEDDTDEGRAPEGGGSHDRDRSMQPPGASIARLAASRDRRQSSPATGRRTPAEGRRGRVTGDRSPEGPVGSVAVGGTVRAMASRVAATAESPAVEAGDIREAVRELKSANLVVIAVDASGSMGAAERVEAATKATLGLLLDAYQRRDLVSLVVFRGDEAEVLLRPTSSVEVAKARLQAAKTGGRTPLAAGIREALTVATSPARAQTHRPLMVLITDGRATSAPGSADPVEAATEAAGAVRRAGVDAVVIDVEGAGGGPRLGLARELARRMGARHLAVEELTVAAIETAVRSSDRK